MKKRSLFSAAMLLAMATGLAACGGGKTPTGQTTPSGEPTPATPTGDPEPDKSGTGTVTLWVGSESVAFYQEYAEKYVQENGWKYKIQVVGVDTGSTGGQMTSDPTACGDIVVTAHDNIGKIVEKGYAFPLVRNGLVNQIEADNPQSFLDVTKYVDPSTKTSENPKSYYYAAPFISQALFLYYNKQYVSAEQAKTFEGLMNAAATQGSNTKAFTLTGTDGFNYSFNLLAKKADDLSTTLQLYRGFNKKNCWAQGEDEVASLQWAKRVFNHPNGGLLPTDAGWATDVKQGNALAVVGGAWHYNAFVSSVGKSYTGIAPIPTYKLTAEDVAGTEFAASTVMQGGTFADCKVLLINSQKGTDKYVFEQELVKYLSSKEVQLQSFIRCANIPAYKGAIADIEANKDKVDATIYDLAVAQNKMAEYGMAQPFITGTLNTYYYQKNAPDIYKNYIAGTIDDTSREVLYQMEHIWVKGKAPESIPDELPQKVQ